MTERTPNLIREWEQRLADARADSGWSTRVRDGDASRERVLPEMRQFIDLFLSGRMPVDDLRGTFDLRTRTDWAFFGLKGLSGGMFLNKLVKNVPDRTELAAQLRTALTLPRGGEEAAQAQMLAFFDYLRRLINSGVVSAAQLQPTRTAFFVSAIWHLQAPDEWPIFYESARKALERDGLYEPIPSDPVESYFRFRRTFLQLSEALHAGRWELMHLCFRDFGEPPPQPPPLPGRPAPPVRRVWLFAPGRNASKWDEFHRQGIAAIGWDELGDLKRYASLDAIKEALRTSRDDATEPTQDALACWEFANDMRPGDLVFAKKGRRLIVGHGVVESDYRHEPARPDFRNVRTVRWLSSGSWTPRERPLVTKTLTEIGGYPQLVAQIETALGIGEEGPTETPPEVRPRPTPTPYTLDDAAAEVFLPRADIEQLVALLRHRKNVILKGPPGVGKTFLAYRLAYLLAGAQDPERLSIVQFHQTYSYEDFVQGYRPIPAGGFALRDGPFLRFCDKALQDRDNAYVMVIDEINRGNVSKILGELLMLIEPDKRDLRWAVDLVYSGEGDPPFYVPANLFLIGTMNTADRSLAMVDYALRRRFAFIDVPPDFDSPNFRAHLTRQGVDPALQTRIRQRLTQLNQLIAQDPNLGIGFLVGHSYFCSVPPEISPDEEWFERIVRFEIAPLLNEYWFDQSERASEAGAMLLSDD